MNGWCEAGIVEGIEKFTAVHDRSIVIENDQSVDSSSGRERLRPVFKDPVHPEFRSDLDILFIDGGDHRIVLDDDYMIHGVCFLSVNVMVKQVPSPGSVSMEISPFPLSTSCLIRKVRSAVCALGRDALFIDPVDQIRTDPAPGVLTGDDIAARVTVDPECDLPDLRTACGKLLDGIFEKISTIVI